MSEADNLNVAEISAKCHMREPLKVAEIAEKLRLNASELVFDDNCEDWKPGDWLVSVTDRDETTPHQMTEIDAYERVFWIEDGKEHMTRGSYMVRVRKQA